MVPAHTAAPMFAVSPQVQPPAWVPVATEGQMQPPVQRIRLNSLVGAPSNPQPVAAPAVHSHTYAPGGGYAAATGYAPAVHAVQLPMARAPVFAYGGSASAMSGASPAAPSRRPVRQQQAWNAAPSAVKVGMVAEPAVGSSPGKTTVMLRNLPDGFSRDALLLLLNSEGFAGKYDFAYFPVDFDTLLGLKHAFVNMLSPAEAESLRSHLEGFTGWSTPSDSVCTVAWNDRQQGLPALVERYRNSPVMHETVPDEAKPIILVDGRRARFPPPTQKIKAPKILKGKGSPGMR